MSRRPTGRSAAHAASVIAGHGEQVPNANRICLVVTPVTVDRPLAAAMLGMSLAHFERHVQPHLKLVYSGRLRLVPVRELERWARENEITVGRGG